MRKSSFVLTTILYTCTIFLTSSRLCLATNYYVTQSGAGTHTGLSEANAKSVAEHNISSFSASDIIYLKGTITSGLVIPSSGSSGGGYITYDGYEPGNCDPINTPCTGQAKVQRSQYYGLDCVTFVGKNYLIFQDMEVAQCSDGFVGYNGVNYIKFYRNTIHDMLVRGIFITDATTPALGSSRNSYIYVGDLSGDGNELYNISAGTAGYDVMIAYTNHGYVQGNHMYSVVSDRGNTGAATHTSENITIEYNSIHDHQDTVYSPPGGSGCSAPCTGNGESGIQTKVSRHITIRYNEISNSNEFGINTWGATDVDIYGNSIHGNDLAGVLVWDGGQVTDEAPCGNGISPENMYVFSNVIFNNKTSGILFGLGLCSDYSAPDNVKNSNIYNNAVINNGTLGTYAYESGISIDTYTENINVKNNILYGNKKEVVGGTDIYRQIYTLNTSTLSLNNNLYWYLGQTTKIYWAGSDHTLDVLQADHGQEQAILNNELDPLFTSVETNDFTLDVSSPAIDTAATLSSTYKYGLDPVSTDWSTTPPTVVVANRDDYTPWDIGAYEYLSGTPAAPQISNDAWTCTADSAEIVDEYAPASYACDDNTATFWHSQWGADVSALPHTLTIDTGATYVVSQLKYLPRQDGDVNGRIKDYEVYASTDGVTWGSAIASGTFPNSASEQTVSFAETTARYFRLKAISEQSASAYFTSVGNVSLFGDLAPCTLTAAWSDSTCGEAGADQSCTVTITATGDNCNLGSQTFFSITGDAVNGTDYTEGGGAVSTTRTISAAGTTNITIAIVPDGTPEGAETATVTLVAGTGYVLGSPSQATLTIPANDVNPPDTGAANATYYGVSVGNIQL